MLTNVALQKYTGLLDDTRKASGAQTPPVTAATAASVAEAGQEAPVEAIAPIPPLDAQAFESAVKDITEEARNLQRSLQFHVDENSGRTIITVIDKQTEEVIRQIPPEEVLSLAEQFRRGGGLFVETEA